MFKKLTTIGVSAAILAASVPATFAATTTRDISRTGPGGYHVTGTKTHSQDVSTQGNVTTKTWTNNKTVNRKNGTVTQDGQGSRTSVTNPDGTVTTTTNRNGTRTGVGGKTHNYNVTTTRTR